jgi:hypothetical protein
MFKPGWRSLIFGIIQSTAPVGAAIGFVVGSYLSAQLNWHYAFILTGAPGILLTIAFVFAREPQRDIRLLAPYLHTFAAPACIDRGPEDRPRQCVIIPNRRESMLIEPIVPAHVILTDEEAISVADEVAKIIRKGAIDRDQKRLLPQVEVELLSRRGLYGLSVPKKYGGAGVSTVTVGNVFRILAAADPSIAQIPQNHFCWSAVLWLGTPEQEAFFFAKFLAGERLGNAASENTRKRPGDHETVAKKVVGGYAVTGKKYYSTGALFAHWIPVFAKDEEDRSIILFVRQGSEGLEIVDDWAGMGSGPLPAAQPC